MRIDGLELGDLEEGQVRSLRADEVERLKANLPAGVHLEPFYDQSQLVRDSITSVRDAILIGLILATLIIIVFLRDWRSSLVAGLVIPTTVAITSSPFTSGRPCCVVAA